MTEVQCMVCGAWEDIEEPDSTDIGCFICSECMDEAADALSVSSQHHNTTGE